MIRPLPISTLFPYTTLFRSRITQKKLYPGYVFVEMKLEEDGRIPQDIFFLIKETTGVGDFIGTAGRPSAMSVRSEEHTSELQSRENLVCRLLLEKKNKKKYT